MTYQCQLFLINSSRSECEHNCETRHTELQIVTSESSRTWRNQWVDGNRSVCGPPRVSGSGFWTGLEQNWPSFAVQPQTAGGFPGPIAIADHNCETIWNWTFGVFCAQMLQSLRVSLLQFENPMPSINRYLMHLATKLVPISKCSRAGLLYINLVVNSYKRLRETIWGVVWMQTSMMGKRKLFGPCLQFSCLMSIALIGCRVWLDPERSSVQRMLTLPCAATDTGRPTLMVLRTIISECA